MSTNLFDFLQQPLPLQLRRAHQFETDGFGQSLVDAFAVPLSQPISSEPQRLAATERLLFARRRNFDSRRSMDFPEI